MDSSDSKMIHLRRRRRPRIQQLRYKVHILTYSLIFLCSFQGFCTYALGHDPSVSSSPKMRASNKVTAGKNIRRAATKLSTITNATTTTIFYSDVTPQRDKYRTLKITIAAFLITVGGFSILGWIYLAILRIQYNQESKREAKLQASLEQKNQPQHPHQSHLRKSMRDEERGRDYAQNGSFEEQFGSTPMTKKQQKIRDPKIKQSRNHRMEDKDTDSFTEALQQAAMKDEHSWNVKLEQKKMIVSKNLKMMQHSPQSQSIQAQDFSRRSPFLDDGEDTRYVSSPRWKAVSSTSPTTLPMSDRKYAPTFTMSQGNHDLSDPLEDPSGDVSTTRQSESASSTTASYAGKYSSTEEEEYDHNAFLVSKDSMFSSPQNNEMNQFLLKPMENFQYDDQEDDSFSPTASLASGTSTSLGIPSVSASTIDRDPTLHGFYVIDEENDAMDQYIPQEEYDAAVLAAATILRNSPRLSSVPVVELDHAKDYDEQGVNEIHSSNQRKTFDIEPLMLSSEENPIPEHLLPYKLTKSTQLVASGASQTSSPSRNIRPLSKSPTISVNESMESSTTGGGTGISTGESSRGSKMIYKELSNVSAFLKTYEKKQSMKKKKKKNGRKFKVLLSGRIPEMAELEDLSVDTSTFDGSNQVPISLPSLSSKSIGDTTSGDASSKRLRFSSFGRQKKGYISEKELQSIEVKVKPKGKKSRLKRSELPPKSSAITSPRPHNLDYSSYPAVGLSPSADSAASERRFLTNEIESFFSQKDTGFFEGHEVSPKHFADRMNERHSKSIDLDLSNVNQDDERNSYVSTNIRLGAAPFNPREINSGTSAKSFIDQLTVSSKGRESYTTTAVQQPVVRNNSDRSPQSQYSLRNKTSLSRDESSPTLITNRSPLSPRQVGHIERPTIPLFQESKSAERDFFEELPAPSFVRESALRAKRASSPSSNMSAKPQVEMGFPKRKSAISSPPPPLRATADSLNPSPLTQSAKKIIETGAKSIASIVERTRNQTQSPKKASISGPSVRSVLNTNTSTHAKINSSSKDTTPVFASTGTVKNTAAQFESKLQSGARSIMSIFGNDTVDAKSLDGGGSQSSDNKITDRISSRLNQIRQNVKGQKYVKPEEELKNEISHQDRFDAARNQQSPSSWKNQGNLKKEYPNPTQSSSTNGNQDTHSRTVVPSKVSTLRSPFAPSDDLISPNKTSRNPGKLLVPEVSKFYGNGSYSSRFLSEQISGDSPPKESAIEKSSPLNSRTRHPIHSSKSQDLIPSFSGTRDIISLFESKALSSTKSANTSPTGISARSEQGTHRNLI